MDIPAGSRYHDATTGLEVLGLEGRYRILFQHVLHGIVVQDASGGIISANPAAERILGLSLARLQGRTSSDARWQAIHEDGSPFPGERHPAMVALATGRPVDGVIMGLRHPDRGDLRWISIAAAPLFLPGAPRPFQVITTFEDVTERQRNHQALAFLAEAGWLGAGEDALLAMARYLAQCLGFDHASIGQLLPGAQGIRNQAVWQDGLPRAGFDYPIAGSPCEQLLGQAWCCVPEGVCRRFPECPPVRDLMAESYLGTTLRGTSGAPIGVIALIGRRPLAEPQLAGPPLRIVGLRAAAELERRLAGSQATA